MSASDSSVVGTMKFALPFGVFHWRSRAAIGRGKPPGVSSRRLKSWKISGKVACDRVADRARNGSSTSATAPSGFGGQRRFGDAGDDRDLGQQRVGRPVRPGRATRCMQPVLSSIDYDLRDAVLPVDLDAAEARQQVGDLAVHEMAAVELRRDLHGQSHASSRRPRCERCPGTARTKLPPSPTNALHLAGEERLAGLDGVQSLLARRLEAVQRLRAWSSGASSGFSVMPTVRWPCTFEWPRTGQMPAPGRPMLPRRSSRLVSIWTFCTPFAMLREAHAVDAR